MSDLLTSDEANKDNDPSDLADDDSFHDNGDDCGVMTDKENFSRISKLNVWPGFLRMNVEHEFGTTSGLILSCRITLPEGCLKLQQKRGCYHCKNKKKNECH